jgi:hypothetical protein
MREYLEALFYDNIVTAMPLGSIAHISHRLPELSEMWE